MIRRITEQTSLLLNSEKLQSNQSLNSLIIFRILQLAQYFAIIMEFEQNTYDNFHLNSIVVIFKAALLDYQNIPVYLGYISTMISLLFFLYIILLCCLNLNQINITKNTALIYLGTLPQYFCLLQLSITAHSLLQVQNNLFEQLTGTLSIILIFIESFLGSLLMRNIYQVQTFLCKDTTFLGLLSQIVKFLTILFYFYDSTHAFRLVSLILALIWTSLEIADILFNLPYSIGDNKIQFILISVRLICTFFSILKVSIDFKQALEIYQLLLGILGFYVSKQIFKLLIYTKCLNHFRSEIQIDAEMFYVKIILYIKLQVTNGNGQHYQVLYCNLLSLHNKYCVKQCQAKASDNLLECLISKMQSNEDEQMFLFKINYIAFVQKQYSLSLMKIKQYQIHHGHLQTWHFKLMVLDIKKNIEEEIQQVLYSFNTISNSKQYTYLTSQDLVNFEQQELEIIPLIIKLVQLKIDIWQQQIRGFQNIYFLQHKLIDFSQQIDKIRKVMGVIFGKDISNISISLVNNMFHLRILSLYFSIIMNDQITSYLCEKQIQIVYYFEQTLKQNELTSLAIITDKISIVAVSLVKKQGDILNLNKQKIGSLFGYMKNNEYNGLLSVNQIIPDFISNIHNEMLTEFLKKGQSPFFVQFKQVFGKNKEYYIMPIQLQFSNDFSVMDDFVIKGVIYQGQKQQDFILFDDLGHIQGITQSLFETLILDNHKSHKIDSQQLTKSYYIYYFIPQIFAIVQEFQKQKVNTQCVQFLEDTQFIVVQDLQEFHDDFTRSARKFTKHTMTDPALYASSYTNCSELTNNNVKTLLRRKMFMEIDRSLLNDEFAASALKFIHNNLEIHVTYLIKFQLAYYRIQNEKVKGFYILEILDYRKHFDRKMDSEIVYRDADSTMKQSVKVQGLFSQRLVQQSDYYEVNCMKSNTNINLNTDDILRLDTNVNSSKRVIFLKPEIEQQDNEIIIAEQSKSSSEEKGEDYLSPPLSKRQFCKENDSVQQIQNSDKNKKHNLSEMEMAINQSQSSGISRQSSRTSTYFHKLFQSKIVIYKYVKAAILICLLTVFVNLFLCIFINVSLQQNYQTLSDITSTMNVPLNLNRYFSKTAALAWINVCQNYSILDISQFQINQNIYQMNLIGKYMFGNISELQLSLIKTESQIPYIEQSQGLYPSEDVKLTYFIKYLTLQTKQILAATEINSEYLQSLIILRYNVKNMHNITSYLMDNLQEQLETVEAQQELNQTLQIIINSFLMAMLFGFQFIYLIKIQAQNQTLTLLVGRVKEQEIQNEIVKTQYLLSALHKMAGADTWKRINFWSYAFQNDYDHAFKKKLDLSKQARASNLNSRIKHMNITYRLILIKILTFLSLYLCFIWGFFALEDQQSANIKPMITLNAQYVRYSVNVDLMVFSGLIIKTQQQLYHQFVNKSIYKEEQINSFDDGNQILLLFSELQSTFSNSMQSLFTDVLSSMPSTSSVTNMKNLIDQDICLTLGAEIAFCQFNNMTISQFITTYGEYNTYDNDQDYLSQGILGIMAKQSHYYQQNYGYELDLLAFNPDITQVESVFSLLDFNNIILSHFKDSYLSFVRFLKFLTSSITDIRFSNLVIQLIYLNCLGLLYFIVFVILHFQWLSDYNRKIRSLKLSLVIIPYEQLFNGSIINVLRRIE